MKTINILNGDTLEGAEIGDVIINGYGESQKIKYDEGKWWVVETVRYHDNGTVKGLHHVLKFDPNSQIVWAV